MKMYLIYYLVLVAIHFRQIHGMMKAPTMDECEIYPLSIYDCQSSEGYADVKFSLETSDDNGGKTCYMRVVLENELNDDYTVILKVDQLNNGEWKENVFNYEGQLLTSIEKYISKLWKKIRDVLDIENVLTVPPGIYETFITAQPSDVNIPTSMPGRYRNTVKVVDPSGIEAECFIFEIEINYKQ